jgi:hypothetical protein
MKIGICFKLSAFEESETEIQVDVLEDMYPEFCDDLGRAFENRGVFTYTSFGINFANVSYYYIYEDSDYERA